MVRLWTVKLHLTFHLFFGASGTLILVVRVSKTHTEWSMKQKKDESNKPGRKSKIWGPTKSRNPSQGVKKNRLLFLEENKVGHPKSLAWLTPRAAPQLLHHQSQDSAVTDCCSLCQLDHLDVSGDLQATLATFTRGISPLKPISCPTSC